MSLDTLSILEYHREQAVENSPSSETFTIVGSGSTFKGIFDKSAVNESEDSGHVTEKNIHARIMVAKRPSGLTERSTKIVRENGIDTYTFSFYDIDEMGQGLLWMN